MIDGERADFVRCSVRPHPGRSQPRRPAGVNSRMHPVPTVPEPSTSPGTSTVVPNWRGQDLWPGPMHGTGISPRKLPPLTRALISRCKRPLMVTIPAVREMVPAGAREFAKSLLLLGPKPTAISVRCRSRADQSLKIVKPATHANAESSRASRASLRITHAIPVHNPARDSLGARRDAGRR